MNNENQDLMAELERLNAENLRVHSENQDLMAELARLNTENLRVHSENLLAASEPEADPQRLRAEIHRLRADGYEFRFCEATSNQCVIAWCRQNSTDHGWYCRACWVPRKVEEQVEEQVEDDGWD